MTQAMKLISVASIFLGTVGCAPMPPAESCAAICSELLDCNKAINGSTLQPGPSCQAECLSKLEARGSGCKSSASYLADCFKTYTCSGIEFNCSDNASSFASDCG